MSAAIEKEAEVPVRSLVRKLAEVQGAVDRVAKNGHNDHFNYKFATESDITAAVRKEMADRRLMLFPNVVNTVWEKMTRAKGGETKLCTLTVEFTVEDGDSGETRKFTILGQGEDSMDKATYKAMTGAEKYALLKLFMIPTGDDPENDSDVRHVVGSNGAPGPSRPAAQASGAEPVRDNSTKVKFGRTKGKHLCDIEDSDLEWQLTAAKKSVDANDPKWHAKNVDWHQKVEAEVVRRLEMKVPASAPASAPSPWQRVVELGALYGKTPEQTATFAKTVLGGKTTVGDADVRTIQDALSKTAKPVVGGAPLFPGVEEQ